MNNDNKTTVAELRQFLFTFSKDRGWEQNYSPTHLAKSIVIEASELLENFQWDDSNQSIEKVRNSSKKQEIFFEVVDVLYYLLMLTEVMKIDLTECTILKLKDLATRYPKTNQI